MVVGVLAIQGDFEAHEQNLAREGLKTRRVRLPRHLEGLSGLVMPGGESTAMLKLLDIQGLREPLEDFVRSGLPVLATCAGMILLARKVVDPEQWGYGLLDIEISRKGYGRQVSSGTVAIEGDLPAGTEAVFIRAPRVLDVGPDVEVVARRGDDPVLVRQGSILAATFHPEMVSHHPVTRLFADAVRAV